MRQRLLFLEVEVTRLLSNLIKSNFIYVNNSKEIIDSDSSFKHLGHSLMKSQPNNMQVTNGEKQFVNDLNIVNMQRLIDEEQALIIQNAEKTMNEARKKAMDIVNQAKSEAEGIKNLAIEEGKKLGYIKGFEAGSKEIERLEAELKENIEKQNQDYQALLETLEPQFVDIMVGLLEKLTNVVVEDQKGVILHLINQAITNQDKSNDFVVWVSKQDLDFVKSKSDHIMECLNKDVKLQILEDSSLKVNQCLIETGGRYIDCSLDIQLSNLITDLKMLLVK